MQDYWGLAVTDFPSVISHSVLVRVRRVERLEMDVSRQLRYSLKASRRVAKLGTGAT